MIFRKLYHLYLENFVFHYFHFLMKKKLKKYSNYITGNTLDIGCGKKPYQKIFKKVKKYVGTNSESYYKDSLNSFEKEDVIVDDGTNLPFDDEIYDSVLNFQVLPVFENPNDFFLEVKRVLKKNGYFLLTTDFLYPIWNAPYNYWRTTKFGLEKLAEANGYNIITIEAFGGYWIMQARVLDRFFLNLLPQFVNRFKNEKNFIYKVLKLIRLLFWLIIVLISPIILNLSFIIFHFLDKLFKDEEFTTNYLILLRK
jgi:SAM-dependent methyltransferase